MLPYDIIREISLYLPALHVAVCREYCEMYNESWYQEYSELSYPNLVLYTRTTYKDLYKRSLQNGKITVINSAFNVSLKMEGIKCEYHDPPTNSILTFNGDMYLESNTEITLLDTKVIDITTRGYIKESDWYVYDSFKWKRVNINDRFISVGHSINFSQLSWACTCKGVYIYNFFDEKIIFIPIDNITSMLVDYDCYITDNLQRIHVIKTLPGTIKLDPINDHLKMSPCGNLYENNEYMYSPHPGSESKRFSRTTLIKKFVYFGENLHILTYNNDFFTYYNQKLITYRNVLNIGGDCCHLYYITHT